MPAPRWLARFNRLITNNLTKGFVTRSRGFGVIIHRGRRSGRLYRTPVNVFRTPEGFVIALTYGPEADWVRNVLAAGECQLETQGNAIPLFSPRLVHDESRRLVPPLVRVPLGFAHVYDFLLLSSAAVVAAPSAARSD
jgi:deazaflavin-dependent oxidoreductase (nitroreductase family)